MDFNSESFFSKSLFLLGDNIAIEISSIEISNYDEIKWELIKGLNEDETCRKIYKKHLNSVGIVILVFILIAVFGPKIIEFLKQ